MIPRARTALVAALATLACRAPDRFVLTGDGSDVGVAQDVTTVDAGDDRPRPADVPVADHEATDLGVDIPPPPRDTGADVPAPLDLGVDVPPPDAGPIATDIPPPEDLGAPRSIECVNAQQMMVQCLGSARGQPCCFALGSAPVGCGCLEGLSAICEPGACR